MSYSEQLRELWKQCRDKVSTDPVDLRTVASWAIGMNRAGFAGG